MFVLTYFCFELFHVIITYLIKKTSLGKIGFMGILWWLVLPFTFYYGTHFCIKFILKEFVNIIRVKLCKFVVLF